MTGFGRGTAHCEGAAGLATLVVEVRAVNHRHLDVRVRADEEVADYGVFVEEVVRRRADRGRIDVRLRLEGDLTPPPALDLDRARSAYLQLCTLRDELAPAESVPLSLMSTVPQLFRGGAFEDSDALVAAVQEAAEKACEGLATMRTKEGEALRKDLGTHLSRVDVIRDEIGGFVPTLVAQRRTRLRDRLAQFVDERLPQLDPARLEQEVALLADKADIAEELSRLGSHVAQFQGLVASDAKVGRKLDFLLQEMGREANTIGSKIQDGVVTPKLVELKACLERLREQVQNVL